MQFVFEAIPNPIFFKDTAGTYLGGNSSWSRQVLGVAIEKVIGKRLDELPDVIPPELAAIYVEQDRRLLDQLGVQCYEADVRCADGLIRRFYFSKATFL